MYIDANYFLIALLFIIMAGPYHPELHRKRIESLEHLLESQASYLARLSSNSFGW